MAVFTFSCPECDKQLKSSNPIAAGKKVRCPRCQTVFAIPGQAGGNRPATPLKKGTPPVASRKAAPEDAEEETPRNKRAEDNIQGPRKVKAKARDEEEEEEEEEEERPPKKIAKARDEEEEERDEEEEERPRKKLAKARDEDADQDQEDEEDEERPRKKKRKKEGGKMPLILGISGGAAVLLILVVTAFLWPGFLLSKAKGPVPGPGPGPGPEGGGDGPDKVLAYAPANSTVLMGANIAAIRNLPIMAKRMEMINKLLAAEGTPTEVIDLLQEVDQFIGAIPGKLDKELIYAFSTRKPYDLEKIKKALKAGSSRSVKGKTVMKSELGPNVSLALPHPRVVLVSNYADAELGNLLTTSKVNLPPEVQQQVQKLESALAWTLLMNQGEIKEGLMAFNPRDVQRFLPGAEKLIPYLQNAKMFFLAVDPPENQVYPIRLGMLCAQETDAQAMKNQGPELFQNTLTLLRKIFAQKKDLAPYTAYLNEVGKTFKIEQQGNQVTASLQIAEKTIEELEKKLLQGAPDAAMRVRSANNLHQIVLALHVHDEAEKSLPPAAICSKKDGKPLLSWRVAILPYIEQAPLFNQFKLDEPWDSPHNLKLLEKMPPIYAPVGVKSKEPYTTYYQAFVGKGAGFEIRPDAKVPLGAIGLRMPADFPDGTANTMVIAEAAEAVPWTKPAELVYGEGKPLPKLGGMFQDGFHGAFLDGVVRFLPRNLPDRIVQGLITRAGREAIPLDDLEKKW